MAEKDTYLPVAVSVHWPSHSHRWCLIFLSCNRPSNIWRLLYVGDHKSFHLLRTVLVYVHHSSITMNSDLFHSQWVKVWTINCTITQLWDTLPTTPERVSSSGWATHLSTSHFSCNVIPSPPTPPKPMNSREQMFLDQMQHSRYNGTGRNWHWFFWLYKSILTFSEIRTHCLSIWSPNHPLKLSNQLLLYFQQALLYLNNRSLGPGARAYTVTLDFIQFSNSPQSAIQ